MDKIIIRIILSFLLVGFSVGCSKLTSPSPLDGIWMVESVEAESGLTIPQGSISDVVYYWEFQNVLFRLTSFRKNDPSHTLGQMMWGYPSFNRDSIILRPTEEFQGIVPFPIPGGTPSKELTLRYETAHGQLNLYGDGYILHLVRR